MEADLHHHYGVDILELYRARKARKALNLIRHLPATSHYTAALAADQELATQMVRTGQDQPTGDRGPKLQEWSPEVAALTQLVDIMNSFRSLYLQSHGTKGSPPKPMPRPRTALQDARMRERERSHESLTARLLGRPEDT